MPTSFKVSHDPVRKLRADFCKSAIGRVASVDSGDWWSTLLRAYTKSIECEKSIQLILSMCLSEGFDILHTLLCDDGCCLIDHSTGVYGYLIEIQALFFMALRCAVLLLLKEDGEAMLSSLATPEIIDLIESRLEELVGEMPLKVCYPAIGSHEWRILGRYKQARNCQNWSIVGYSVQCPGQATGTYVDNVVLAVSDLTCVRFDTISSFISEKLAVLVHNALKLLSLAGYVDKELNCYGLSSSAKSGKVT
ncbi:unnamed protein product [Arabidopsis lyrata]|nr:unnamed protein product [Arabidopsis lyrata]